MRLAFAIAVSLSLAACSSGAPKLADPALTRGSYQDGRYTLGSAERSLGCGKLRGRITVRLMQVRGRGDYAVTSAAARAMQSVVAPAYGTTTYGSDPIAEYRRDVAVLRAYNQRLAELNCPTFDLDRELQVPANDLSEPAPRPR